MAGQRERIRETVRVRVLGQYLNMSVMSPTRDRINLQLGSSNKPNFNLAQLDYNLTGKSFVNI